MSSVNEEFEVLSAIYPEASRTQQGVRFDFESGLFINVVIPPSYPCTKPVVSVRVPWVSEISAERAKADALDGCTVGRPMLLDLCSALISNLPTPPTDELGPYIPYNPLLMTEDKSLATRPKSPKPFKRVVAPVPVPENESKSNVLDGFLSSESLTIKKSVFQGHVVAVETVEEVKAKLDSLRQHRKLGKATHNIWAYKLASGDADFDDDGVRTS
mmetsp:Transcript_11253/g.22153  ORF Transcript_11253/g.22153 Transcript_11253/m.22153 type:complete len:215 (+) Transcript_11253:1710-2354(+)